MVDGKPLDMEALMNGKPLNLDALMNPALIAHGMVDDVAAYEQDILSRTTHASGNQFVTVKRDSRLGKAIVKSNPALYGGKTDYVTLSEKDAKTIIKGCVCASTADRLVDAILGEGEEGESPEK